MLINNKEMFKGNLKTPEDFINQDKNNNPFLGRRAFKGGVGINKPSENSLEEFKSLNKRRGIQNVRIIRPAFRKVELRGRTTTFKTPKPTFEIGEKTLNKMFVINEPDPTDKEYLDKYETIKKENPDFTKEQIESLIGRPQRIRQKKVNFAQGSLDITKEIKLMNSAMRQGLDTNREMIEKKLLEILSDNKMVERVGENRKLLEQIIDIASLTSEGISYSDLSLPMIVNGEDWKNMKGLILMYLFGKSKEITTKEPLRINIKGPRGIYMKVSSLMTNMASGNFDLNLQDFLLLRKGEERNLSREVGTPTGSEGEEEEKEELEGKYDDSGDESSEWEINDSGNIIEKNRKTLFGVAALNGKEGIEALRGLMGRLGVNSVYSLNNENVKRLFYYIEPNEIREIFGDITMFENVKEVLDIEDNYD